LIAHIFDVW
jgi:hypothetical protein